MSDPIQVRHQHILGPFESALQGLRESVLSMASQTGRILENARVAFVERDSALCDRIIENDAEIDQLEMKVDSDGVNVILRFQPVASDLRHVIAQMKLSGNLERVADQGVNIARRARNLNRHPALPEAALLQPMFETALAMFRDSLRAFSDADAALALGMKERDRALDEVNRAVCNQITEAMVRMPSSIENYLHLIFIAARLERVGDHATNIAEESVYAASAQDIRHLSPRPADAAGEG